jgi:CxxC-x17-CxxC domain-containing protein
VEALHSGFSQNQRDRVMEMFRGKRLRILVATDIAARGLDIPHVDAVINYDVPKNPLIYFHRVGRTARAGGAGKSFILVSPRELEDFTRIQDRTSAVIKPAYREGGEASPSSSIQKYCARCERWVNFLTVGNLCKCADCGRILGFSEQKERRMYPVTCSECGRKAEVPFKPLEGRATYCRECYRKRGSRRPPRRPSRRREGGAEAA